VTANEQSAVDRPPRSVPRLFRRLWFVLVVGIGVIVPAAGINGRNIIPLHTDFVTFYAVGMLVSDGRAGDTYDDRVLSAAVSSAVGEPIVGLHWLYPPGMMLVTWPLAMFAALPAYLLWMTIGIGCLGYVAWRICPQLPTLLLLPLCPAVAYCVITGQVSLFAAALAGGGLLLLMRRPALAGILFGILTLKIQLALLLPFCLLAGRHYRALALMAGTAVLLQLLGLFLGGFGSAISFWNAASSDLGFVADHPNLLARMPTIYSAAVGLTGNQTIAMAVQAVASLGTIVVLWFVWRRSNDIATRSLAWSAGALLAAPYVFDYDLAIFVIPLAALAWRARIEGVGWTEAAIMTVLWWAAFALKYVSAAAGFQVGPLMAMALLAYAFKDAGKRANDDGLPRAADAVA
jgi:hypothetical protein